MVMFMTLVLIMMLLVDDILDTHKYLMKKNMI